MSEIENEICTNIDKKNLIKNSSLYNTQKEKAYELIDKVSYSELKQLILEIESETKQEIEQEIIKKQQEKDDKINKLKENGYSDYCEYKVIKLSDSYGGSLNINSLTELLNNYALDGWRVKASYANELGKNMSNIGIGVILSGSNSTLDEHIIILERIIKI